MVCDQPNTDAPRLARTLSIIRSRRKEPALLLFLSCFHVVRAAPRRLLLYRESWVIGDARNIEDLVELTCAMGMEIVTD